MFLFNKSEKKSVHIREETVGIFPYELIYMHAFGEHVILNQFYQQHVIIDFDILQNYIYKIKIFGIHFLVKKQFRFF